MSIRLETNKWYQTRNKKLIKIVCQDPDKRVINPFTSNDGVDYCPDGNVWTGDESADDIIREVSHIGDFIKFLSEQHIPVTINNEGCESGWIHVRIGGDPFSSSLCCIEDILETAILCYRTIEP